jgi:glutathione peroxidase
MSDSIYDVKVRRIDGTDQTLGDYAGKVLLIVNVASQCGLTPQYASLERLYQREAGIGLAVLGFPSNEFGAQEPGSNAEIAAFCSANYGVTFPMFEKISVNGAERHPLYRKLIAAQAKATAKSGASAGESSDISWNFEKFLVARDGRIVQRFAPDVTVEEPILAEAVERELAR